MRARRSATRGARDGIPCGCSRLRSSTTCQECPSLLRWTPTPARTTSRQVVVATGPFQTPFVPPIAMDLDSGVTQIHSVDYRNPQTLPAGKVLVVGAANSGCQIALELTATHSVELSAGQGLPTIPQQPLGRDVWWWASGLRLDRVTAGSRLGRRLAGRDQVIGAGPRQLAKRHGIRIRPRATSATSRTRDLRRRYCVRVRRCGLGDRVRGEPRLDRRARSTGRAGTHPHRRGITPSPGLYLLGLTWQHTRTSALLGWVGSDASYLADQIASPTSRTALRSCDPHPAATPRSVTTAGVANAEPREDSACQRWALRAWTGLPERNMLASARSELALSDPSGLPQFLVRAGGGSHGHDQ
jgi:hypothetical protein